MPSNDDIVLRALGYTGPTDMQAVTADDAFRALKRTFRGKLNYVRCSPRESTVLASVDLMRRPMYAAQGATLTEALIAAAAKAIEAESKDA